MTEFGINGFDAFVKINSPKRVTGIDYVRSLYKTMDVPNDFVLWFARLLWPRVMVLDGRVFIADLFDSERYKTLLQSDHSESSAQFWTNLLEITGLFDDLSESDAFEMAEGIAASWNCKIDIECSDASGRARVIHDKTTGEIFISIGAADNGLSPP